MSTSQRRTGRPWALRTAWILPGLLVAACDNAPPPPPEAPPAAVSVIELAPQDVTPSDQFVGRVVAVDQVDLRARVEGFLEQRLFTEGDQVEEGDLLYVIEQPPFQAQVDAAKADVAKAEASVAETQATLERVTEASSSGAVSKQEVDQATADDQRARAEVLSAKAKLQVAELDLGYTEIKAPIKGRIGLTEYTIGNLVGPESGVLATIVNQDPIYVTFPVSSRIILEVRQEIAATGNNQPRIVRAELPNGKIYDHPGNVNFVDIQADQTTDTITVRAQFPNPDGFLVDGEFVNVVVEQRDPEQAIVVPQSAMQIDQAGSYVLLVNAEDEVEQRRIEIGQTYGPDVAVTSGLEAGDKVIVEGIQKARPGAKVDASVVPQQPIRSLAPAPGSPDGSAAPPADGADQSQAPGQDQGSGDDAAPDAGAATDAPAAPAN
ncbi:MAG: efflux RND transporter periplasmic adaptor subunit [Pseudomonadota bacterium]